MDKALASVKVDAHLLGRVKIEAALRSARKGRPVTIQEIFAAALRACLHLEPARPKRATTK